MWTPSSGFLCCAGDGPCWAEAEKMVPDVFSGCGPHLVLGKDSHILDPANLRTAGSSQCNCYFLGLSISIPPAYFLSFCLGRRHQQGHCVSHVAGVFCSPASPVRPLTRLARGGPGLLPLPEKNRSLLALTVPSLV